MNEEQIREEIARVIKNPPMASRIVDLEGLRVRQPCTDWEKFIDQILSLITTEIEKVGNPNVIDTEVGVSPLCSIVANQAFEQCRWTILNLLKEQK